MKCESYFRICGVQPELWVNLAALHCVGATDQWLQTTQAHNEVRCWDEFMERVPDKFGKEEFQFVVRQFSQLKQTWSVVDYTENFNSLVFNLTAHHPYWDPIFFVTQFVEGLRSDIKSVVLLHRPKDLDIAASLAVLQEEILYMGRPCEVGHVEASGSLRSNTCMAWPIPPPPSKLRMVPTSRTEERPTVEPLKATSVEDKWAALRAYRQARGLCRTCGDKWSRCHRCASIVPLHVVEEVMAILADEEFSPRLVVDPEDMGSRSMKEGGDLMMISKEALEGGTGPRTVRLKGVI